MWQPRAGPRRGHIVAKQLFGTAGLFPDDGRTDIAVAQFGANHLIALRLLHRRDADQGVARGLSLRRVVTDLRPVLRSPLAAAQPRIPGRTDVAVADLAPFDLVRPQQIGSAPPLDRRRQLPGEVDRIADAGVHAKPSRGDHQVRGVARQEHASGLVTLGQQQVQLPGRDREHLVRDRHTHRSHELRGHVGGVLNRRMQRPVLGRVLHDQERRLRIDDVVVAPPAGPGIDRQAVEQVGAVVQRLLKLQQVAVAPQGNPQLAAHGAGSAVAADDELCRDGRDHARAVPYRGTRLAGILSQRQALAVEADGHAGQTLGLGLEQRLQGVLRNELVRLERQRAVRARRDLSPGLGHRRIFQPQEWRAIERQRDVDIHRHVAGQPGRPNLLRQPHPPEDLHRPGVAPFHFRQELRGGLFLDHRAADAAAAEVDGQRESDRAGADDQDIGGETMRHLSRARPAGRSSVARHTPHRRAGTSTPTPARR